MVNNGDLVGDHSPAKTRTSTDTRNQTLKFVQTVTTDHDSKVMKPYDCTGASEAETEVQDSKAEMLNVTTSSANSNDMQEVTDLFSKIKNNRDKLHSETQANFRHSIQTENSTEILAREFDGYLRTVMESLSKQLGKDMT